MKKLIVMMLLVMAYLISTVSFADDANYHATGDVTIDSTYDGNWECVDSLVVAAGAADTVIVLSISGVASLDPGDRLYIGFGNDSANRVDSATSATTGQTHTNLDTLLIRYPRPAGQGKMHIPFSCQYIFSSAASTTDTFYFNLAVWGDSHMEKVEVEDVVVLGITALKN